MKAAKTINLNTLNIEISPIKLWHKQASALRRWLF
jgi:hypothetical protein